MISPKSSTSARVRPEIESVTSRSLQEIDVLLSVCSFERGPDGVSRGAWLNSSPLAAG